MTEAPVPRQPSFILQVRSFPDPDSADARRAEIILNGLSADVIKTTENGQTGIGSFLGRMTHRKLLSLHSRLYNIVVLIQLW